MVVLRLESCCVGSLEFQRAYRRVVGGRGRLFDEVRCPICFNYVFADRGLMLDAYTLVDDSLRFPRARDRAVYFAQLVSRLSWNARRIWCCGSCVGQMIMNRVSYSPYRVGRLYAESGESRWLGYVVYPLGLAQELGMECLICDVSVADVEFFPRVGGSVIVAGWGMDLPGLYADLERRLSYCVGCAGQMCNDLMSSLFSHVKRICLELDE